MHYIPGIRNKLRIGSVKSDTVYQVSYLLDPNPFTTGNPFWGTKLLGLSIVRGSGALKGSRMANRKEEQRNWKEE